VAVVPQFPGPPSNSRGPSSTAPFKDKLVVPAGLKEAAIFPAGFLLLSAGRLSCGCEFRLLGVPTKAAGRGRKRPSWELFLATKAGRPENPSSNQDWFWPT